VQETTLAENGRVRGKEKENLTRGKQKGSREGSRAGKELISRGTAWESQDRFLGEPRGIGKKSLKNRID